MIQIIDGFNLQTPTPIDSRIVVANDTERLAITSTYAGLRIWQVDTNTPYFWDGGTDTWVSELDLVVTGQGTDNFIPKFKSSNPTEIEDSQISDNGNLVNISNDLKVSNEVTATTFLGNLDSSYLTGTIGLDKIDNNGSDGDVLQLVSNGTTLDPTWVDLTGIVIGTSNLTEQVNLSKVTTTNYYSFIIRDVTTNFTSSSNKINMDLYTYETDLIISEDSTNMCILAHGGSKENPPYSFHASTIVLGGIYYDNSVSVSYSNTEVGRFDGSGFKTIYGSESSPSISFIDDADTGIYRPSDNVMSFSTNGNETVRMDTNGFKTIGGSSTDPSISFIDKPDTGLFLITGTSTTFGITHVGSSRILIKNTVGISNYLRDGNESFDIYDTSGRTSAIIPVLNVTSDKVNESVQLAKFTSGSGSTAGSLFIVPSTSVAGYSWNTEEGTTIIKADNPTDTIGIGSGDVDESPFIWNKQGFVGWGQSVGSFDAFTESTRLLVIANGGQGHNVARLQTSGNDGMGLFITKDGSTRITGGNTSGVQMVDDNFSSLSWKVRNTTVLNGNPVPANHLATDDSDFDYDKFTKIGGDPGATLAAGTGVLPAKNHDRFVQAYLRPDNHEAYQECRWYGFWVEKGIGTNDFRRISWHRRDYRVDDLEGSGTISSFIPAGCRWGFNVCAWTRYTDPVGTITIFKMGADRYTDIVSI